MKYAEIAQILLHSQYNTVSNVILSSTHYLYWNLGYTLLYHSQCYISFGLYSYDLTITQTILEYYTAVNYAEIAKILLHSQYNTVSNIYIFSKVFF